MKAYKALILLVCLAFILSPIIFFPPSEILTQYMDEGTTLIQGKEITNNTNNISVLATIIYGIIGTLSNNNIFVTRLVEFFIHLLTTILLFLFIKKYFKTSKAVVASIIYAVSITILNYKYSFQIEPLSNIFIILLMAIHLNNGNSNMTKETGSIIKTNYILSLILEGMIISLMMFLKFNFIFIIIGIIAYDIFYLGDNFRIIFRRFIYIAAGVIIFTGLYLLIIKFIGLPNSFSALLQLTNLPEIGFRFIRDFLKDFALYLSSIYSVLLLIALFYSILSWLKNIEKQPAEFNESNVFAIAFYSIFSIILSLVFSKDLQINYLAMLFIPFCVFISDGVIEIYKKYTYIWKISTIPYKAILLLLAIFLIIYSPLPFWIYYVQYPLIYLIFNNHAELL